ncbi:MBOAT family O-acyltransferase [Clostridium malenominatum]|uniref:MBOAT family O-acyltransferase n=1 Tax=Clostridium malenominatum TaxID=1539 RepID=UPI0031D88A1D
MIVSIISGYLHGLWIFRARSGKYAKIPLISSIIVHIGLLVYFKYIDFLIKNINEIFNTGVPLVNLALPIGISFYTFQILSYTVDVYWGKAKVQKNIFSFATYVALFPQLIAGPIVRYTTVEEELEQRTHSIENFSYGINRFIIGLSKKVLLANTLGELGKIFSNTNEKTVLFYWIAAVAFTLQVYFDFSGYSDMAIGLGRIFGFHFLENFNYPYISKSITEFWKRWHMSLGTWFRDYLYIPMGGNRVSRVKWVRNIVVVWFLTGFWHGAQWNFIVWGLYFALFLILEKHFLKRLLNSLPPAASHMYTLFFITVSFVLFNANSMSEALENLQGMFGMLYVPLCGPESLYYLKSYGLVLIMAGIGATPLTVKIKQKLETYKSGRGALNIMVPVVHVLLMLLITGYLVDGSFNPFLYFRF